MQDDSYQHDTNRQGATRNSTDLSGSSRNRYGLHHESGAIGGLQYDSKAPHLPGNQNHESTHTYASIIGSSLSRSASPDPELVRRVPSPCLPPIGVKLGATNNQNNGGSSSFNRNSPSIGGSDDLVSALSGMNLSSSRPVNGHADQSKLHQDVDSVRKFLYEQYMDHKHGNGQHSYMKHSERSLIELPLEIFAASVNSCFMFYRANLHFHVKHG